MGIAKQLYQLQEVDLELDSAQQALARITGQLGESQAVVAAHSELNREQQRLEELGRQQRSTEWEISDFTTKVAAIEEKLYGGRVTNPKELANLQHEAEGLKSRRSQVEDKALELMERISDTGARVAGLGSELGELEADWQREQQQLSAEAERYGAIIADLDQRRLLLLVGIDPLAVSIYNEIRKRKGRAVAKVQQGSCRGCGISLATAKLQQARGERLVQCSTCGRILFVA